jgi:hypothetical protein
MNSHSGISYPFKNMMVFGASIQALSMNVFLSGKTPWFRLISCTMRLATISRLARVSLGRTHQRKLDPIVAFTHDSYSSHVPSRWLSMVLLIALNRARVTLAEHAGCHKLKRLKAGQEPTRLALFDRYRNSPRLGDNSLSGQVKVCKTPQISEPMGGETMTKFAVTVALVASLCLLSATAMGKCYRFSVGESVRVCVKGDAFSHRKRAKKICDKVRGKDCGTIASISSSCFSNEKKCFDSRGKAHRSLSGF